MNKRFNESLKNELKETFGEFNPSFKTTIKRNDQVFETMTVTKDKISANIYLNDICSDDPIEKIEEAIKIKITEAFFIEQFKDIKTQVEKLQDEEAGKTAILDNLKNVRLQVINTDENKKYLIDKPHEEFLDLSLIPITQVESGIIHITTQLMECTGYTKAELFEIAWENTMKQDIEIVNMLDLLALMGMEVTEDMEETSPAMFTICSMDDRSLYIAAVIANNEFLKKVSEKVGGSFYLLPSSIYELIAIPDDIPDDETRQVSECNLKSMISDVNYSQVNLDERLSNNLYHYDTETKQLEIVGENEPLGYKEWKKAHSNIA